LFGSAAARTISPKLRSKELVMLTFGKFESDMAWGCVIHAQSGSEHVRFDISSLVLTTSLGGGNPVHHDENMRLCESKRTIIEPACQRAYDQQPAERIALQQQHFNQV
jgi:hypothetical protein